MFWIQSSILFLAFLEPIISQHSLTSHDYHPSYQYSSNQNRENQPRNHESQRKVKRHPGNSRNIKTDESSNEEFKFPVQRNPDGKLNVVFTKPSTNRTVSRSPSKNIDNKDFVFPDQRIRETVRISSDEVDGVTPLCKKEVNKPFCTEVENYPAEQIEQILRKQSIKFEALFGDDLVPESFQNISQRIDPGEDTLCESVEKLIHPKAGETMNNKKLIIVNQDNYKQGVRVEECTNPGKKCRMSEFFPNGHVTECKQKYIYRQMVAMDENKKIVTELFKLPSCCICVTWTERY